MSKVTKECYAVQPSEVEVFRVGKSTDVIIRKNIKEIQCTNEDGSTYSAWECEEVQYRYPGIVSKDTIAADLETWWSWEPEVTPSVEDDTDAMLVDHEYRLTLLELGVTE